MKKEEDKSLFNNASIITTLLLVVVVAILLISQSFAISNNLSVVDMFSKVINYNYIYFLLLIYFILLKTSFGKKYFNFINLGLIIIYLIKLIGSFFTIFQTLTLSTLLGFIINIVIVLFLTHTLFRDTRVWKEYNFNKSPFNEIEGEWYYDFIVVACSILLAVDLISSTSLHGVIISILDYIYMLLFSRYIYLYSEYLDKKKINVYNDGNIDVIVEKAVKISDEISDVAKDTISDVKESVNDVKEDVDKFVKDNKIDEKVDKVKKDVADTYKDTKKNVDKFVKDNKIDEKVDKVKKDVVETYKDTKKNVDKMINKKENKESKKISNKKKGSDK